MHINMLVDMKKNYYTIVLLSLGLLVNCSKKYTTRPQLEIKSISTPNLNPGDSVKIVLILRDREGDVSSSSLYIERKKRDCNPSQYEFKSLPSFPTTKDFKGDLTFTYQYNQIRTGCIMPGDTCILRFVCRDNAGNISDTVNTGNIFIR